MTNDQDDVMTREPKNVDEFLTQTPVVGEVVVRSGDFALRVSVENGEKYIETLFPMDGQVHCVCVKLTDSQAMKLAMALIDEGSLGVKQ